jgi:hypothetical protein
MTSEVHDYGTVQSCQVMQGALLTQDLSTGLGSYDGYVNSASKHLIASVKSGTDFPDAAKEDDQAHSLIKVPIVLARYIGTRVLIKRMTKQG